MNISEVMTEELVTCGPDETLSEVARKLQNKDIGSCPIVDQGNLVGIVTDRDITTRAVARGLDVNSTHVREVMSTNLITGSPDMSLEDACELMSDNQIRRLPILAQNKLVGIVALADLAVDLEEDELLAETLMKISEPVA